MNTRSRVILVSDDQELIEPVSRAIGPDPALQPIEIVPSLDVYTESYASRAALVIVDIAAEPADDLAKLYRLIDDHPSSRFIVIAAEFDKDQLLRAMQAGARHFMPREWINDDMRPLCRELLDQVHQAEGDDGAASGSIITVLPASGGCGATTVGVNLASEMAIASDVRSLVVDFDVRFGGVAAHLGLKGQYGIADVLDRGETLDAGVIASTAIRHGEGLDVLLSPASIKFDDPAPLNGANFELAATIFQGSYPTTILDAPALVPEAQAELANLSSRLLLVLLPTVKDVWVARSTLVALRNRDVETPVTVILNRAGSKGAGLSLADVRDTLEHDGDIVALRDDPAAGTALNAGLTLAEHAPKSKLRKEFVKLAETLGADAASGRAAA